MPGLKKKKCQKYLIRLWRKEKLKPPLRGLQVGASRGPGDLAGSGGRPAVGRPLGGPALPAGWPHTHAHTPPCPHPQAPVLPQARARGWVTRPTSPPRPASALRFLRNCRLSLAPQDLADSGEMRGGDGTALGSERPLLTRVSRLEPTHTAEEEELTDRLPKRFYVIHTAIN